MFNSNVFVAITNERTHVLSDTSVTVTTEEIGAASTKLHISALNRSGEATMRKHGDDNRPSSAITQGYTTNDKCAYLGKVVLHFLMP